MKEWAESPKAGDAPPTFAFWTFVVSMILLGASLLPWPHIVAALVRDRIWVAAPPGLSRHWLVVIGLGFDVVGALVLASGLVVSKKRAMELGRAWLHVKNRPEANLQHPPVQDRLRQSRGALAGIGLLIVGFLLQIAGAWPSP